MRLIALALLVAVSACSSNVGEGNPVDAGPNDPDAAGGGDAMNPPGASAELYPTDRTLSPITPHVADNLRAIAAAGSGQNDVFAKVGASATVSLNFMHCFAGSSVDLDGRTALQATVDHFAAGNAAGTNPYQRESLSATVGWSAGAALSGDPSPLEQELAAINPAFAVIMYGTNDIQLGSFDNYGANMMTLADQLIDAGVIPVFTTIMPRDDSASADLEVPRYNNLVRAVAQSRQVPLIDYHRELVPLPDHGIGGDGIHPTAYSGGACVFTADGLTAGYNIRNLITIQTLDRLERIIVDGEAAPDAPVASLAGTGSHADPFIIDQLPFVHAANTRESLNREVDTYTGCSADQDESGAEYVYKLELTETTTIRAYLSDPGVIDIDLHLMAGGSDAASCLMRDHRLIVTELSPGTYYFNLDSFTSGGTPQEGDYLFVVMQEP